MPYTRKKTVEMVRETENHLLVQLKRNQPTLYARLLEQVVPPPLATVHHSPEVGQHNRLERRTVSVWPLATGIGAKPWHDHFQTFIQVERQTDVFDTRRKAWTSRDQTAYYLATTTLTAAHAATLIRATMGVSKTASIRRAM